MPTLTVGTVQVTAVCDSPATSLRRWSGLSRGDGGRLGAVAAAPP